MTETMKEQPLGATLLWSVSGEVLRSSLEAAWDAASFKKFVPPIRRPNTVLGDALARLYVGRKAADTVIVRPLGGRTGFAIVDESRGDSSNDYACRMSVKANGSSLAFTNVEPDEQERIREAYRLEGLSVNPGQLGSALAKAVMEGLSGVPLRPTGGVYWVPLEKLERYNQLAAATRSAGSGAVLYSMTNRIDPDTLAAVRDAAIASMTTELEAIQQHLESDVITPRGVEARQADIEGIRHKIETYEAVLQDRLPELREKMMDSIHRARGLAGLLSVAA